MTIVNSSLALDVLAQTQEIPEPVPLQTDSGIPINPMVFPHDWSVQLSLQTRWQTDVTRPALSNLPEKWILASRPTRLQKVRVLGATREEAFALLQAAASHTSQSGSPIPLYCDEAILQEVSTTTLRGDFSFRRFFVGGRVAILPFRVVPSKGANSTIFATIKQLSPGEMVVEYDPSTTRTPKPGLDAVYPCIDVELVPESSGTSRSETSFEIDISWQEVEGVNALPALWPSVDQIHGENLSPFCAVVDGLPVFPFDYDWAEGISFEPVRNIGSTPSGRSAIQEPQGDTYFRLTVSLTGDGRKRAWDILRFFDSMRGRAGTFYIHHPHRPWTLLGIPATNTARIKPVGDAWQTKQLFKRVAFFRADGSFVTRILSTVVDSGPYFQITLVDDLPDTNWVDIQPIFQASFEEDSIEEVWSNTETHMSLEFPIVTEPTRGGIQISSNIAYQTKLPDFLDIPGCNLLLRAGAGCTAVTGRRAMAWPAADSNVWSWEDVSSGPARTDDLPPYRHKLRFNRSPGRTASLIRYPVKWQNNGQAAIKDPSFSCDTQTDVMVPIAQRHLWGPTGWTVFICFTPEALVSPSSDKDIMRIEWDSGQVIQLFADRSGLTGNLRAGIRRIVVPPTAANAFFIEDISSPQFAQFITLHWDGPVFRAWINGKKALNTVIPSSMALSLNPLPSSYTASTWFEGWYHNLDVTSPSLQGAFGREGAANMVVSYNRPLTIDEINSVHVSLGDLFRTQQTPSLLY